MTSLPSGHRSSSHPPPSPSLFRLPDAHQPALQITASLGPHFLVDDTPLAVVGPHSGSVSLYPGVSGLPTIPCLVSCSGGNQGPEWSSLTLPRGDSHQHPETFGAVTPRDGSAPCTMQGSPHPTGLSPQSSVASQ